MLQQILQDMYVDPELLAELDDDQKQILFCKMREEQVRRWKEKEDELEKKEQKQKVKKPKDQTDGKKIGFILDADGQPWVWVMGEHRSDKTIEQIVEDEAMEQAMKQALQEAEDLRIKEENELKKKLEDEQRQLEEEQTRREAEIKRKAEEAAAHASIKEAEALARRLQEQQEQEKQERNKKLKEKEKIMRRKSSENVHKHLERRSSQLIMDFKESRQRFEAVAEQNSVAIESPWLEQEKKAKEAEKHLRETARRAREEHRLSAGPNKITIKPLGPISQLYLNQTAKKAPPPPVPQRATRPVGLGPKLKKPKGKEDIINWFKNVEKPKGVGLDLSSKKYQPWFHGIISRQDAEDILTNQRAGTFLVRVSERVWGYAISYKGNDRCKHFLIDASDNNYTFFGTNQIPHDNLTDLITYHKRIPISMLGQEFLLFPCDQQQDTPDYYELFHETRDEESRL